MFQIPLVLQQTGSLLDDLDGLVLTCIHSFTYLVSGANVAKFWDVLQGLFGRFPGVVPEMRPGDLLPEHTVHTEGEPELQGEETEEPAVQVKIELPEGGIHIFDPAQLTQGPIPAELLPPIPAPGSALPDAYAGPPSTRIFNDKRPTRQAIYFMIPEGYTDTLHVEGVPAEYIPPQIPHAGYFCKLCTYDVKSRPTFTTHMRRDHFCLVLLCPLCNHPVWSGEQWKKHVLRCNPDSPQFARLKSILQSSSTDGKSGSKKKGKKSTKATEAT